MAFSMAWPAEAVQDGQARQARGMLAAFRGELYRCFGQAPGCAVRAGRCGAVQAGPGAHAGGAVAGAGVPPRPRRGV